MSDDTINTPQDTTPVTPEPASAESVDFLLDELSGAGVVEVKQEAAPVVEKRRSRSLYRLRSAHVRMMILRCLSGAV